MGHVSMRVKSTGQLQSRQFMWLELSAGDEKEHAVSLVLFRVEESRNGEYLNSSCGVGETGHIKNWPDRQSVECSWTFGANYLVSTSSSCILARVG